MERAFALWALGCPTPWTKVVHTLPQARAEIDALRFQSFRGNHVSLAYCDKEAKGGWSFKNPQLPALHLEFEPGEASVGLQKVKYLNYIRRITGL